MSEKETRPRVYPEDGGMSFAIGGKRRKSAIENTGVNDNLRLAQIVVKAAARSVFDHRIHSRKLGASL